MIFVTVGSQKFPFDRLLKEVDQLIESGVIKEEVFAQTGHSTYLPQKFSYQPFLDQSLFEEKLKECDVLITHGGTGVIVTALKMGKKIIAVPRLAKYQEHVDNHQIELLAQFSGQNLICYCEEVDELASLVETIHERTFETFSSNTTAYLEDLTYELSSFQEGSNKYSRFRGKANKYVEYLITKSQVLLKQKTFQTENERVHYLFKKNNSSTLIVVFSSCTRKGVAARYNYVRTLKDVSYDQLFILDDWGYDRRGIYYLGHEMSFSIEAAVEKLIQEVVQQGRYKKVIFAGSSKGGYAALNFGLKFPNAKIIAGAPQYKLGDYFTDPSNKLEDTLRFICGEQADEEKLKILNRHLNEKIEKYAGHAESVTIALHYSDKEHTYEEHICDLLNDLNKAGYHTKQDIHHYHNHSDISLYFPQFLLTQIKA
ncbi:PssE/Cps14G family polysaccharide biosynthesis glycosyltransferase [Enterococcus sp. AZ109]|uniref:PssE/Cps14G family polysaccharide biosynthesis glycosyltransferase n=1 Tax=Enterococcus sp. AZ109 TaxID=2774634 RepID=UPI003F281BAB